MKEPFVVAIEHSDNFFSIGLKSTIRLFFNKKGREVRFIELARNTDADLIIISEEKTRITRPCRIRQHSGRMITVLNECGTRENPREVCVTEVGAFYPRERTEVLLCLMAQWYRGTNNKISRRRRCPCCSRSLIKVEKDVLRWVLNGLPLATMAKRLNVSIQSVSRYKRSAMSKLGFERNHELYQWLLKGGLEHEERILTWQ